MKMLKTLLTGLLLSTLTGCATSLDTPDGNRWVETPEMPEELLKDGHLKYVTHYIGRGDKEKRNYSMLYDTDRKMALWVAYPLCRYYMKSNTSRTDKWTYDPDIAEGKQANLSKGIKGYDRGHQIPSADRLVSATANRQTFYFTNATPQEKKLNQGVWQNLEEKVRKWAARTDTLYVVTGAIPDKRNKSARKYAYDSDGEKMEVPTAYYKALARIDRRTGKATTIAFKLDNEAFPPRDFMKAAISVAELEGIIGYTLFPTLDATDKETFDRTLWK